MRRKIKILLHFSAWLLLIAFVVVTYAFSVAETADVVCHEIEINYSGKSPVALPQSTIMRLVRTSDNEPEGKRLQVINAELIEREVAKHPSIEKASVYKMVTRQEEGYRGVLTVRVKHRTPLLRVITSDGSYYMDRDGHRFPTAPGTSASVVLVTGNAGEDVVRNDLIPMILFMQKNELWTAQIKQIHVGRNNELLLTPLVGDQLIEFGTATDYQEKFRNLMAFYEQVLAQNRWQQYERISLKFKGQVIAKKR